MKRALKIFLWAKACAVVITLTQAATFAGIWAIEKEFLTGVWTAPSEWLGTVILWKYVAVGLSILGVLFTSAVTLTRKGLKKRTPKVKKQKKVPTPKEVKPAETSVEIGTVMSNTTRTSNPGKFTRVPPKK